jgi:hypothetical protein
MFPSSSVKVKRRLGSDYAPLVVDTGTPRKQFHFEKLWLGVEGFE